MKKEEVKNNLAKINKALSVIKKEDKIFTYATKGKYLPGNGEISEVEDIKDLIKFQHKINQIAKNDNTEVIAQLGIKEEELPEEEATILGLSPKHWNADIKTKLEEIRHNAKIEKLNVAKITLEKHLSNDDKFEIDTDGIDSLLAGME
jgi:hypothetical protein